MTSREAVLPLLAGKEQKPRKWRWPLAISLCVFLASVAGIRRTWPAVNLAELSAVHSLSISDGPLPPPLQRHWVKRVCTPAYEGPDCSNATTWQGVVTLNLDGQTYHGVKVKTRGHVSALFPKHQFLLKFPSKVSILGMPASRSFVLATSFIDTTFQRNPLAFDLYRNMGGWATRTSYVRVHWHGAFYGLFYVGEKIMRGRGRLEIPAVSPKPENSGYLLVVDWPKPTRPSITTSETNTSFNVYYPKQRHLTANHKLFLKTLVSEVDSAAAGSSDAALENAIDYTSFIRYYILQEIAKDADGYAFSDYFAVRDGKLFHAAPWDFDLAFHFDCTHIFCTNALTGAVDCSEQGWNVENLRDSMYWIGEDGWPGGTYKNFGLNKRQLFLNIWRHRSFRHAFASTWRKLRTTVLSDSSLDSMVRSRQAAVTADGWRDLEIWNGTERNCAFWYCCHAEDGSSMELATDHLLSYLLERVAWIDANVGDFAGQDA